MPGGTMSTPSRRNGSSHPYTPYHLTSASRTMEPPILSARRFARLALVDRSGDLKPIRRPLPPALPLYSESEVSCLISSCLTFCTLINIGRVKDPRKAKCTFFSARVLALWPFLFLGERRHRTGKAKQLSLYILSLHFGFICLKIFQFLYV
jgi:hypothetical protein